MQKKERKGAGYYLLTYMEDDEDDEDDDEEEEKAVVVAVARCGARELDEPVRRKHSALAAMICPTMWRLKYLMEPSTSAPTRTPGLVAKA
jgi:hypothetical protein